MGFLEYSMKRRFYYGICINIQKIVVLKEKQWGACKMHSIFMHKKCINMMKTEFLS